MIFMNVSFVYEIPRNSIEIIIISQSMLAFSIISTIGIIWSIFIVSLSKTSLEDRNVPGIFKKFLGKKIQKINSKDNVHPICDEDESEKSGEPKRYNDFDKNVAMEIGWYEVTRLLDKIYFAFSVLTCVIVSFVIFRNIEIQ
jgi:hypothetical protein